MYKIEIKCNTRILPALKKAIEHSESFVRPDTKILPYHYLHYEKKILTERRAHETRPNLNSQIGLLSQDHRSIE